MLGLPVRVVAVLTCALATHALVYGTLRPADGVHGYFGWYEPAVFGLSLAALLGIAVVVALAVRGRRLPALALPARPLACASFAALVLQETLERSVALGHAAAPALTPSQWLVLLAGIAATALALSVALRGGHALAARLVSRAPARRPAATRGWSIASFTTVRRRPLAERRALRAPPLLAG